MEGYKKSFEQPTNEKVFFKLIYKSNDTGEYFFDLVDVLNTDGSLEVFRESIRIKCKIWNCLCFRYEISNEEYLSLLDKDLNKLNHLEIGNFSDDFKPKWEKENQINLGLN